jgi:YidC/Oxa1 family membrane protein insertase
MIDFLWNTFIYDPMVNAILWIYSIIGNYGIAIILFTLIVRLITLPLTLKQQQSFKKQAEKQARIAPKLAEIKKKYKDDPKRQQEEQMKLYQAEGMINPFNMGCLLSLIPWPIFIGLYNTITSVMSDRPEQLMDLSRHLYPSLPNLASVVPVSSTFLGLNLAISPQAQGLLAYSLVVLVVASTWAQSKMMQMPAQNLDPQQASMNQSMQLMMPLMIGFFSLSMPSGLSLYWIVFNLVGMIQQYFTTGWGSLLTSLPGLGAPSPTPVKGKKNGGKSASARQNR